jgi:nitroreductase
MKKITDQSQERYLMHQGKNKAGELAAIMKDRHSNRIFDQKPVDPELIAELAEMAKYCPSSCDRRAVRLKLITDRQDKDLLDGLLVGGTGWVYRVPAVFLLFGDRDSYKAGDPPGSEVDYNMPLDAGAIMNQLYLAATAKGLHCAFINPQVRERNKKYFLETFKPVGWEAPEFLGAFCFGYPADVTTEKHYNYDYEMIVE